MTEKEIGALIEQQLSQELQRRFLSKPAKRGRLLPFAEGFLAPFSGLSFMSHQPGLWRYGIIPVVLNMFISILVLVLLVVVAVYSVDNVHANIPEGWLWMIVTIISDIALFLLAIVGVFVTWLLLQVILCAFFYEKLARQVELLLGINPDELRDVPILDQISTAVRDAIKLVIVNVGLLFLHLVPVIGSVAAMCGSFYFNFLILGSEFLVFPLDLRGRLRVEKRQFVRQHRYHTLGLGAAVMLLLLLPIIGSVLLTTAVTGSVLLHRRLIFQSSSTEV
jgi:uncharacterized protein involved in cysteine biosynthesis